MSKEPNNLVVTLNHKMPGEDDMIRGMDMLREGLRLIFKVMGQTPPLRELEIEPGMTLWGIASINYGNPQRWREVFLLNMDRIMKAQQAHDVAFTPNPDLIYAHDKVILLAF